jgi:hypothetical protein
MSETAVQVDNNNSKDLLPSSMSNYRSEPCPPMSETVQVGQQQRQGLIVKLSARLASKQVLARVAAYEAQAARLREKVEAGCSGQPRSGLPEDAMRAFRRTEPRRDAGPRLRRASEKMLYRRPLRLAENQVRVQRFKHVGHLLG